LSAELGSHNYPLNASFQKIHVFLYIMPCEWVSASRSIKGMPVTTHPVAHCHTPEDVNPQTL
jgi:hypothetical protein